MNQKEYLEIREYAIKGSGTIKPFPWCQENIDEVKICWRGRNYRDAMNNPNAKIHWAIIRLDQCMGKNGKWIHEPSASNRDNDFIEKYRYDSVEQAMETYRKYGKNNE